ncbi:MAG: HAD family hydrolase [Clostridia bacterium]|nr:HAD family hydrolase [Clostridia bacterium]
MNYKCVIFDLDGTLLDTLGDLTDSVNFACETLGFGHSTKQQVKSRIGDGILLLLKRSLPQNTDEQTVIKCRELFKSYYESHMDNLTAAFPQAVEIVDRLYGAGIKMGVASNKYDLATKYLIGKFYGDKITCAVGEGGGIRRKPCPDSVLAAAKILGADLHDTIYIGDSATDVQTAHNAGLKCIGVTWGFRSREVLENARADFICENAREVLDIIGVLEDK